MEKKVSIVPVGTIIAIDGENAIVVGYEYRSISSQLVLHYILLPYPNGYGNKNDLKIAPAINCAVVKKGYENEAYHLFAQYIERLNMICTKYPPEIINAAIKEAIYDQTARDAGGM